MFHLGVSDKPIILLVAAAHRPCFQAQRVEPQLNEVEMEERRLEDARAHEEMMEVRVDLHSDELDSDLGDERPLIQDRDPNRVNSSLKVDSLTYKASAVNKARLILADPDHHSTVMFEDVIAEPPSVRSFDKVWLWSHALFEVSRLWCYRFISLLLAVPVSLAAGLLFAVLSCLHIWLIMPCVQLLLINMQWIQTVWASILNVFISPFWSSFGKCCGQVVIHMADTKTR